MGASDGGVVGGGEGVPAGDAGGEIGEGAATATGVAD